MDRRCRGAVGRYARRRCRSGRSGPPGELARRAAPVAGRLSPDGGCDWHRARAVASYVDRSFSPGTLSLGMPISRNLGIGVALAAALALLTGGLGAQDQTFRSGTHTVRVHATVTAEDRRLVPDLVEQDFEVLDNGKPQKITLFDNSSLP